MELDLLKEAFDRVAKKQKQSSSKTLDIVNQIEKEIEQAITKIQTTSNHTSVLTELKDKLNELAPMNQLDSNQKDINLALAKYSKLLEKCFQPDISRAYRNVDTDPHVLNEIISTHFYRQGLFDLGDCFTNEAREPNAASLKLPFVEMYQILESMRERNLEPALAWAAKNRGPLTQNGSTLELKLHQLQFVEILKKGNRDEALKYARTHLACFAATHKGEIQKLMACLLWAGRLDQSPYTEFTAQAQWEELAHELARQFCGLLGQSYESPLEVAISAGVQGLPTLLKLSTVMAGKKEEWQNMKQLPVALDLGREFQFHSVFVCPVLREPASEENPPMLLPCGHVLSKQSIVKLSKSSTRPFKCPYCPSEATISQCRQLHF
uniref:Protein RMD5 homolog n=1 Tax=Ananas comosus var. bracteatus TaxID=296719 RepID=A0A6V7PBY6_ANACO|nr:unnamed protein product [Ananas comosus var. bracteatus]